MDLYFQVIKGKRKKINFVQLPIFSRQKIKNTNIGNFIPSEDKIRKEQEMLLGHVNENNTELGTTKFRFGKSDDITYKERPYVKSKN